MASNDIENRLWAAADLLRANSRLRASDYSAPVLGLIFLLYADYKFSKAAEKLKKESEGSRGRSELKVTDYHSEGVMFIPETARFSHILNLAEGENIGKAINKAIKNIEKQNANFKDVLPKSYNRLENDLLVSLLKTISSIQMDMEGDVFGKIYEYFLGKFAMAEGKKGGEFFTPTAIVKLIVEVIEPFQGRIYDPACGSGGMFVQSAHFVERHKHNPNSEIAIYGQERTDQTIRLCKLNLAVHGLEGEVKQANTYYDDAHQSYNKFDFVMANPPFNVNGVDKDKINDDIRFSYGIPRADNANYLWIQIFWNALSPKGRAGFVMANSASDARQSEMEIRKKLVDAGAVDIMIAIGSNFFYTVALPCTLWFLDRGKTQTDRKNKVLFIDARNFYRQIDRTHRDFIPEQIEFLANIVRLYRGEVIETTAGGKGMIKEKFPDSQYQDIPGICKVANLDEIREHDYSLNPGRYVGVAEREEEDFDFSEKLEELNEKLEQLNHEAHELEDRIADNVAKMLEQNV